MTKYFITFGAGGNNFYEAGKRLINQAEKLELFDKIIFYTDKDLKNDIDFWKQHSTFIENNKRGYGYYIWKSYIIKKTMEKMKDNDILLHLDAGCEIDIREKEDMIKYLELIKTNYIIGTDLCNEKDWTKMDLILKLDMLDDKYLNSHQRQGGANLFLICDKTRNLVNEWYELGCDYHNIDDSPSIVPNIVTFREHRHDQSIFSLLTKKYNLYSSISLYNCKCIHSNRNKTGVSQLK